MLVLELLLLTWISGSTWTDKNYPSAHEAKGTHPGEIFYGKPQHSESTVQADGSKR